MKTSKISLFFISILAFSIIGLFWAFSNEPLDMAQSEITTRYVQPGAPTDATICSLAVVDCPLEGSASWYDFTLSSGWSSLDHRVAAMRDVPRGTMVRVTNMENGKSVEVLIADYGPAYPDRVIDLSSYAFSKLAPTTQGIIQEVKIELL